MSRAAVIGTFVYSRLGTFEIPSTILSHCSLHMSQTVAYVAHLSTLLILVQCSQTTNAVCLTGAIPWIDIKAMKHAFGCMEQPDSKSYKHLSASVDSPYSIRHRHTSKLPPSSFIILPVFQGDQGIFLHHTGTPLTDIVSLRSPCGTCRRASTCSRCRGWRPPTPRRTSTSWVSWCLRTDLSQSRLRSSKNYRSVQKDPYFSNLTSSIEKSLLKTRT